MLVALLDDVSLQLNVIAQKVNRVSIISIYATHFRSRQQHIFWFFLGKEFRDCGLVTQVQLGRSTDYQIGITRLSKPAN